MVLGVVSCEVASFWSFIGNCAVLLYLELYSMVDTTAGCDMLSNTAPRI